MLHFGKPFLGVVFAVEDSGQGCGCGFGSYELAMAGPAVVPVAAVSVAAACGGGVVVVVNGWCGGHVFGAKIVTYVSALLSLCYELRMAAEVSEGIP